MADDSADYFADTGDPVRIPITDVFDLHSVAPRDVRDVVEAYLEEAHKAGFRAIRIVHGRGIGVQRETVRKVLARASFVVSYGDAPAEAGGWGATIATLASDSGGADAFVRARPPGRASSTGA
jgi:DNA-nicking Smr family endonuclease